MYVWCGDTITGTDPFTVNHIGPLNQGNIDLPVTFTNSGNEGDGWNLVGNPYPCPIDWDNADITKTNISGAIYVWNPDNSSYASYVQGSTPGAGVGTNGGSRYIGSSQAFWVQANAAAPELTLTENSKADENTVFIKSGVPQSSFMLITVSNGNITDESILRIEGQASEGFDPTLDAWKIYNTDDITVPQIGISSSEGDMSINSMAPNNPINNFIKIQGAPGSSMILQIPEISGFESGCLTITDLENNTTSIVDPNFTYNFVPTQYGLHTRFKLNYTPSIDFEIIQESCPGSNNGYVSFDNFDLISYGSFDIYDDHNQVVENYIGNSTNLFLENGSYTFENNLGICGSENQYIQIDPLEYLEIIHEVIAPTCETCNTGSILLSGNGGTPGYSFEIQQAGSSINQHEIGTGETTIIMTDGNGCSITQVIDITLEEADDVQTEDENSNTLFVEQSTKAISIYPNPFIDLLNIKPSLNGNNIITILDISGRVVYQGSPENTENINLNLSYLSKGTYILQVQSNDSIYSQKILKK